MYSYVPWLIGISPSFISQQIGWTATRMLVKMYLTCTIVSCNFEALKSNRPQIWLHHFHGPCQNARWSQNFRPRSGFDVSRDGLVSLWIHAQQIIISRSLSWIKSIVLTTSWILLYQVPFMIHRNRTGAVKPIMIIQYSDAAMHNWLRKGS